MQRIVYGYTESINGREWLTRFKEQELLLKFLEGEFNIIATVIKSGYCFIVGKPQ